MPVIDQDAVLHGPVLLDVLEAVRLFLGQRLLVQRHPFGGVFSLQPPPALEVFAVEQGLESLGRLVEVGARHSDGREEECGDEFHQFHDKKIVRGTAR